MKKRLTKLLIPMLASAGMMTVMAVETGALPPVYNDYVYDALKNNYLVIQDVKQDTASMSIGASYQFHEDATRDLYGHKNAHGQFSYGVAQSYNDYWLISNTHIYKSNETGVWYGGKYESSSYSDETKLRIGGDFKKGSSVSSGDISITGRAGLDVGPNAYTYASQTFGTASKGGTDIAFGNALYVRGEIFNLTVVPVDNESPSFVDAYCNGTFNRLYLRYDEQLRTASSNTDLSKYTLQVTYVNAESGSGGGKLNYVCTGVSGDTLVYQLSAGQTLPGVGRYQITSISQSSTDDANYKFDVWGMTELNEHRLGSTTINKYPLREVILTQLDGMYALSDLAGNAVSVPSNQNLEQYNIIVDNEPPKVEKVSLSGGMVTDLSKIQKDQWTSDLDPSALYAGSGDQMYFNVHFNEIVRNTSGTLTLNVMQNGTNITLKNPKVTTVTNAMGESATLMTYGPFTVSAGMTMDLAYADKAIGIKSMSGTFTDTVGNRWISAEMPASAQGIYLDAAAPEVTMEMYSWMDGNGKPVLTPTIKLTMDDGGSGIIGLTGKIGVALNTPAAITYKMAVTDSPTPPSAEAYTTGIIPASANGKASTVMTDIDLYSGVRYIHLDLTDNKSVNLYGLSAVYSLSDYAGNLAEGSIENPEYIIDTTAPSVTAPMLNVSYSADGAKITGSWTTYEKNKTVDTYFQWSDSDTKPDYYDNGWIHAGNASAEEKAQWTLPEDHAKVISGENANVTLWVYAKDASGNVSSIVSASQKIYTQRAASTFVLKTDAQEHLTAHEVMVTPLVSYMGEQELKTYTRVRVTFGEGYIHNEAPEDISTFLESGKTAYVVLNSDGGPQNVMALILNPNNYFTAGSGDTCTDYEIVYLGDVLDYWYGEVKMEFESACYDLTVQPNKDIVSGNINTDDPRAATYSDIEGSVSFMHVPDGNAGIWRASVTDMPDTNQLYNRTLEGMEFTVALETMFKADAEDTNNDAVDKQLDAANSFVTVRNKETGVVMMTAPLYAMQQSFLIPAAEYETGVYEIAVTYAHSAGLSWEYVCDNVLVVDNEKPQSAPQVTEYYITPGSTLSSKDTAPSFIQLDENGKPVLTRVSDTRLAEDGSLYVIEKTVAPGENLEELTLSLAGQKESVRTATYSAETSGLYNFGFTLAFDGEVTKQVGGMTAGKVEGFYIWNPAIHTSRAEGWIVTADADRNWIWKYDSENATEHYEWSENSTSGLMNASPAKTDNIHYDMTGELKLTDGENIIRYQVVMENGNVSPIYELTIYVTSSAPEAGLNLDVKRSLSETAESGEPINIIQADASLANVFSGSNIVEYYWLDKNYFSVVETPSSRVYNEETGLFESTAEVLKNYEYNRYSVITDLENGYYADLGMPKGGTYALATSGGFYDSDGVKIADPNVLDGYFNYSLKYFVTETEADTVVRLDNDENYGTMKGTATDVSGKYTADTASGAFMVIDESGATVLVFPQLINSATDYDPTLGDVVPQYNMVGKSAGFFSNLTANTVFGGVTVEAELSYAGYIDIAKSSVVYLDENDEVIKRLPFEDAVCTDFGSIGTSFSVATDGTPIMADLAIDFAHPITDSEDIVESQAPVVRVYVELYDSASGEYLISDTVVIDQLVYKSSKPESVEERYGSAYINNYSYDIHYYMAHWPTYVSLDGGDSFNFNQSIYDINLPGTYPITVTDAWGNSYEEEIDVTVTGPIVELSSTEATSKPIIVTVTIPEDFLHEECFISWDNNTTSLIDGELRADYYIARGSTVKLEIKEKERLHFHWEKADSTDQNPRFVDYYLPIENVSAAIPEAVWSVDAWREEVYEEDENGDYFFSGMVECGSYNGGDVTVYLEDASGLWELIDPLTGERPEYTFKWDDPSLTLDEYGFAVYTFRDICTNELDENGNYVYYGDYTVTCPVLLREYVAPEIENLYPEEEAPEVQPQPDDTRTPSVRITPYAIRDGKTQQLNLYYIAEDLSDRTSNGVTEPINPTLTPKDESYTAYTDAAKMLSAVGWANRFRFQVEVQDNSKTRIFIKEGLYPDVEVTYAAGSSDAISGVALSGAILDVTASAKFTVYVVDEKNNTVIIPMDISNVSENPVPTYTKTLATNEDGSVAVKIQLIAPDGGSDIVITALDGTNPDTTSDTVSVDQNGSYTVSYRFLYNNTTITGSLVIDVNDIDNEAPAVVKITWSRSAGKPTNTDVFAYIDFNKQMVDVQCNIDYLPSTVSILITGTRATVRYNANTEPLKLIFKAANGQWTKTVELPEVTNIDFISPVITISDPEVSDNAKSAVITLTSDEKVSFREGNGVGTEFTRTLKENGTYTYTFTDMAGNTTVEKVTLTALVTEPIMMQYSLNADGTGAVETPASLGAVNAGDTFYVKVSRDADIHFDGKIVPASAETWTEMTVGTGSGGVVMAKDTYGNTASGVFPEIFFPDITPPMIDLKQYTVHASLLNTDAAELETLIRDNAITADDREGSVFLRLEYTAPEGAGTSVVKYIAVDASENTADIEGLLRIYDGSAPEITLDGVFVERGSICLAENDAELLLRVNLQNEPYKVTYKTGIKTEAQMKIGSTELEMTDGEAVLPFAGKKGYYTVCVSSQSRDIYRFIVYIK